MPTPPFTYSGPSTAGAFTAGVFNLAWDLAAEKATETTARVDDAIALATNPAQITPGGVNQTLVLPVAPTAPVYDPNAIDARFAAQTTSVINLLTTSFTGFLSTYFPTSDYLTYAQAWLVKALNVGGTGFAPGIEDAMWQRDRARLLTDAARNQGDVIAVWANRGYPLPPGAANAAIVRVGQDALDKIAASSRDQVIKAADMEIENIRFAVTNAIDLRVKAIGAAGDYIRALALGPTVGAQVSVAAAEAQARLAQVISALYTAQVEAAKLPVQLRIADADLRSQADIQNNRASTEAQHDRVSAAISAASALSSIAASAVNSLHAQSGISGNELL